MNRDDNGLEWAILAAACVAVVTLSVVWAGANLAAVVFGSHDALGVGLGEAARAVPKLVSRPGDPAAAWPMAVRGRLPGPVAYWLCTVPVVVLVLVGLSVVAALGGRRRVGFERRKRMGLDPECRFARGRDMAPLWVRGPAPKRMVLGRVEGRLVATEDRALNLDHLPWWARRRAEARRGDRGAVVVLGPTRCGKTTALAVPALLEWDGPVIALSVKSDLMGSTIRSRRCRGDVKVFDPADATWESSSPWSPLRAANTLTGAKKAAKALANAVDWSSSSGDMAFWVSSAEDLLAPLFFVAANNDLGMAYVVSWVLTMDRPSPTGELSVAATLVEALSHHVDRAVAADARQAKEMLEATWGLEFRQLSSVYVTAKAMVSAWNDPTVVRSAAGHPVDLDWLLDETPLADGGRRANTLFMCAPLHEAQRLAPVLGGLLGDLFEQAYEKVGKDNKSIGPVLVIVDEAGNWPLRNLQGLASTCAGIGLLLVLIYQSKAQIDAVYGRQADTILSNCLTKVFFAGLSDESTLKYAEALLGSEHVRQRQVSVDVAGVGGGRRSISESAARTELMPMALLRQVRPGEALLLHNTLPPAHLVGRYFFRDPRLNFEATGTTRPSRLHWISGLGGGGRVEAEESAEEVAA
ncbi:MAG: type IV secretory system conjugative DNA transfer family protein [Actinobacteria bacterium]|nr:type IV secretory system conjugative DNA transfer family protein [Actinomycetota bacterium]